MGLAVVIVAWGIAGVLQKGTAGNGGYDTGLGGMVSRVEEDGPADSAGLKVDDRILSVGSIPLQHAWSRPDLDRVGVGAVQSLTVERAGQTVAVNVVWTSLARAQWRSLLVDFLVTSAFLGFGLWAILGARTSAAEVLAAFGLCYGAANFDGPSIAPLDGGIRFVQLNLSFVVTVLLSHLLLIFPRRKTVFKRALPGWLVYIPFLVFLVFGLLEWTMFPALISEYRLVTAVTDLLYMVLALVALVHTWATLGRDGLRHTRFNIVLWGLGIAIGPFVVLGLLGLALPDFVLPGAAYLPLLGAVIPGSMALAVVAGARATSGAGMH
jgi:hypothetical protein